MADLTHEEFKALVAEVRGYNRRHPLGYDPREFQGAYYYERGFLSCLIAGAAIPLGITPDTLLIPRHRVILEVVRELAEAGIRGNPEALITWLSKTGTLEKAGGAEYVREIEGMTGIAAALSKFTLEIRRLALERLP
jgi:hypothetical protein